MVFLAELGDKTQISTIIFAANSKSTFSVFLGSALALIASSLLSVYLGSFLSDTLPITYIHTSAGLIFIIIGILLIAG